LKIQIPKLIEYAKNNFKNPYPELEVKSSAVVIPLFTTPSGEDGVVLTKRSENLRSHPGQVSFPGGVHSSQDKNFVDTAFREWEEEVGVSQSTLQYISTYKPVHTFTGYIIHPIVARYTGNFQFSINPKEVDELILLDLDSFLTHPFYTIPNPRFPAKEGVYYLSMDKHLLWGATCYILVHFLRDFADFIRQPTLVSANLNKPPFLDIHSL
jgi:8-oxo-dGTP pyrophosphatase MutT (NUDIX family)